MTQEQVIRIGIVGAGSAFREQHLPNLKKLEGIELVAVANRTVESARQVAEEFGIRHVVDDWRALIARSDLDAVMIGTWTSLHGPVSIAALEAGKHVFCQAPMASDLAMARQMLATAEAHPQQVSLLFPSRLRLPYDAYIRRVLRAGELGQLTGVDVLCTSGSMVHRDEVRWYDRVEQAGKQLLSVSVYTEALNGWVGPYRTLSAVTTTPIGTKRDASGRECQIAIPQVAMILGLLENGAAGVEYHSGIVTDARTPNDLITLHGLEGTLRYYIANRQLQRAVPGGMLETVDVPPELVREWRVELDFIEAIRAAERGKPWTPGGNASFAEGLDYMKKVEAVNISAATGERVDLRTL